MDGEEELDEIEKWEHEMKYYNQQCFYCAGWAVECGCKNNI